MTRFIAALSTIGALLFLGCSGESATVGSSAPSTAKSGKPAASAKSSAAPVTTNQPPPPSGPSEDDRITAADFEEEAEKEIDTANAETELSALEKEIAEDK